MLGTSLSRCSGFFREVALAAWMGASAATAPFFIAYRLSQLLRRLFGEGALLSSFIPHFEKLRAHSPEQSGPFFRDLCASITVTVSGIILIVEGALGSVCAWGGCQETTHSTLLLVMWMLPGVLFSCLYALFTALLHTQRRYFLTGMAPLFFNLVFISVLAWAHHYDPSHKTLLLAAGVSCAFAIQAVSVVIPNIPFLKTIPWRRIVFWSPELRKLLGAITLSLIGIGATQINSMIDTLFAHLSDTAGPAYLYYAQRLYQLPLALIGIALASALLPPLTRAWHQHETTHFTTLLYGAVRRVIFWMVPTTLFLGVAGRSCVALVYGRGAFDVVALVETTRCLMGYSLGLLPSVLVLVLAPAFYARHDFTTPLKGSLLAITVHLGLNTLFIGMWGLGPFSVALSTTLAAYCNGVYLWVRLQRQIPPSPVPTLLWPTTFKVAIASLIAAVVTMVTPASEPMRASIASQLYEVAVHTLAFSVPFLTTAWLLKIDEFRSLTESLFRRA